MTWMLLISVVQIDSSFLDEPRCFPPGIPQTFAVHLASIKMHTHEMLPGNSEIMMKKHLIKHRHFKLPLHVETLS